MEWVWSYFVDSSTDSDTRHDAGHKSSTRAGAVHAQPSKQASGSSHWEGQKDDKSRKQQRTDGQQTAPSSSGSTKNGAFRQVISKTGWCFFLLGKTVPSTGSPGRPAEFAAVVSHIHCMACERLQSSCNRVLGRENLIVLLASLPSHAAIGKLALARSLVTLAWHACGFLQ